MHIANFGYKCQYLHIYNTFVISVKDFKQLVLKRGSTRAKTDPVR